MDREHILTKFDLKPCGPAIRWLSRQLSWTAAWENAEDPEWMMWAIKHSLESDMSEDRFIALEELIIDSVRDNTLDIKGMDLEEIEEEVDFLRSLVDGSPFSRRRVTNIISYLDNDVRICQYIRNLFPQPVEDK